MRSQHRRAPARKHASPFRVKHFSTAFALGVPGGSTFGISPSVSDTVVASIGQLGLDSVGNRLPSHQYRALTIGGIRWFSEVTLNDTSVAGVAAVGVISECLYVCELDVSGVPTVGGQVFLQTNEFSTAAATNPAFFPERILWRRQHLLQVGALGAGDYSQDQHPDIVKTKVRMSERDALVYRVEISNPTMVAVDFAAQAMAAIACKYALD